MKLVLESKTLGEKMNFSRLKKIVILAVLPMITASSNDIALAGGSFSKLRTKFNSGQRAIIADPRYLPAQSVDGGRAYFKAWNGVNEGKDFEAFVRAYSSVIQNERSATTLKNSERNSNWHTGTYFAEYSDKLEDIESRYSGEYILRVDYENKIIYTIRKSGDEYLCTFYTLFFDCENPTDLGVGESYYLLLLSDSKVKQLLLPIDKELLN